MGGEEEIDHGWREATRVCSVPLGHDRRPRRGGRSKDHLSPDRQPTTSSCRLERQKQSPGETSFVTPKIPQKY